jgi:hypothetical protein
MIPALEGSLILFSTYFWYSFADGKFEQAYTGFLFLKVTYILHAVFWFTDLMDLVAL